MTRGILGVVPLGVWARWLRPGVVGLCYHVVSEQPRDHLVTLGGHKTPAQFEADLLLMKRCGRIVSCDELAAMPADARGRRVPRPRGLAFLVSFDDGYSECHSVVAPLLARHSVPCTFFLVSSTIANRGLAFRNVVSVCLAEFDRLEGPRQGEAVTRLSRVAGRPLGDVAEAARWLRSLTYNARPQIAAAAEALGIDIADYLRRHQPFMTVEQVRELAARGHTIGAHSVDHPRLGDLGDDREVERQIVESCEAVAAITGAASVPFAFPFNADKLDRSLLVKIRQRHPVVGLMFDTRGVDDDEPFIVNRMGVDAPGTPLGQVLRRNYVNWKAGAMGRQPGIT